MNLKRTFGYMTNLYAIYLGYLTNRGLCELRGLVQVDLHLGGGNDLRGTCNGSVS